MFVSAISVSALNVKPYESPDRKTYASVTVKFVFPPPTVSKIPHYDSVEMQDMTRYGAPGEPVLPFKTAKILIPQGRELQGIYVTPGNRTRLEGKFNLEYGKTPIPISSNIHVVDRPNQAIYSSSTPFPGTLFSHVSEQFLRGYKIVLLTLHPVQYIPKTGELFYYETMAVTINVKETGKTSPLFRNLPQDRMLVLGAVDNPEVLETYTKTASSLQPTSLVNPSESYEYVIITNNALNSSFQPLVDWKIQKGLNATIVLVEDVVSDPDYFCDGAFGDGCASKFNDTAARIRNFIKDAYQNWGTEYVLLGGDTEIIPERGVYAFVATDPITVDYNIPCDMYYGALDGSWDNDNDTIFGEGVFDEGPENGTAGEEADFFAEVYIGRATVETPEETENFVNKTLWYEQATDDNYFKNALMMGEKLDDETYGANNKDLATDKIPQYTTTKLYDRDGTFSHTAVINNLNSGPHIVNHDGHANKDTVMDLERTDVDSLTNTEYFMAYSIGCYAAAFDGSGSEAIAEHFIFNHNGSFAFIGNSRYGWYLPGTSSGPGDKFDREFFYVLNNTARNLGKALQLSKENQFSTSMDDASRWTYFDLNLLGDPETEIVTAIMAPTAHFQTVSGLKPPVLKGDAELRGTARRGTAAGATFGNFTVEYGEGRDPTVWNTLGINLTNDGQSEIENDVLATWNARLVAPYRTYTLKLTVYDGNGRIGEDRWIVKVEPPTVVQVNPQLTEIRVPQTFTVDVEVTNVKELYELEIYFSWNTTLVEYVNHTVYDLLNAPLETDDAVNQTTGTYWIWSQSQYPASPFDGSGTVFEMTFQAKAPGTCILNISSSHLLDRFGGSITHDAVSGSVQIGLGVHDVAVTYISVSKNVACQGLSVDINVTVENQGSYHENFNVTTYANETAIDTMEISLTCYSMTVITFTWNTTDVALGNYTIEAIASVVSGENDTADNTYIDSTVTIIEPSFDVAVMDIDRYKTIVGQEYSVLINVTAQNQADLTCTFNVTAYADLNITIIGDEIIIGIQNVTLTGGNSTFITFTWNTAGITIGNYTISAYATPLEAEADLEDNTYIDNWIIVTIPGDVDGDFDVDLYDAVKLLYCYGTKLGDPNYDSNLDINDNGQIYLYDAVILLTHYGQKGP